MSAVRFFFYRPVWLLGLTATLLSACAQPLPLPMVCPPAVQPAAGEVRMMVLLRQPTAGDASATISQLQDRVRACVRYLSSVSPSLHVYAIVGGGDAETLRQNLRAVPIVQDAVPDQKAQAHQPR